MAEMTEIVDAAPPLSPAAAARVAHGEALRRAARQDFDRSPAELRFTALMAGAAGA